MFLSASVDIQIVLIDPLYPSTRTYIYGFFLSHRCLHRFSYIIAVHFSYKVSALYAVVFPISGFPIDGYRLSKMIILTRAMLSKGGSKA